MTNKLTKEEKAEVAARKRHKPINDAIRAGRGVSVDVPIVADKTAEGMSDFIRASTGRSNGEDSEEAIMDRRRAAAEKNILLAEDGVTIKHDFRTPEEKAEQEAEE